MAQRKRHQPRRACRDAPPPPVEEFGHAEPKRKVTLVAEKKRRKRSSEVGAATPLESTTPREGDVQKPLETELWRRMNSDLGEKVLSHLPVYAVWAAVTAINPTRWRQMLCYLNILGHAHVDSSIGLLKTYTCTQGMSVKPEDDLCPPPPCVFEHITKTWQLLPGFPECNIHVRMSVQSVSQGLILMTMVHPEDGYKMAIWNPVAQSHRWLPTSSLAYSNQDVFRCMEVLVVDREKRSYKVIEFVESMKLLDMYPRVPMGRGHGSSEADRRVIAGYKVYDSFSATWGEAKNMEEVRMTKKILGQVRVVRKLFGEVRVIRKCMVSCEGCACFITLEKRLGAWELPRGILCYDPSLDLWSEVLFPPKFFDDLPGHHAGCCVKQLLYAAGKVYMIFLRKSQATCYLSHIASIALANVQSGVAAFEHVGRLKESLRGDKPSLENGHGAPRCSPSKPQELILQHPSACARAWEHRWYMLPVGNAWYLCVVVCGRWHKRFDLHACVWTDMVIEVPSDHEHDQAVMTTVMPSGSVYSWDAEHYPYVPSWLQV